MPAGPRAGSVSRYTSDPHLDLKRQLFMHDCNKSYTASTLGKAMVHRSLKQK